MASVMERAVRDEHGATYTVAECAVNRGMSKTRNGRLQAVEIPLARNSGRIYAVAADADSNSHPRGNAMPIVMYSNNNISSLKTTGLGVCFGQCTFFAKLSKERDCTKTDASTIESNATAAQSLFMLDSGSYDASRDRIFKLHGLTAGLKTSVGLAAAALADTLVANNIGQTVFIDVTLSPGAHVVAARLKSATQLEYFDPNEGLFREGTAAAFRAALVANFTRFNYTTLGYYPVS
jgi:hypothetical protein